MPEKIGLSMELIERKVNSKSKVEAPTSKLHPGDWTVTELGEVVALISGQHILAKDYNTDRKGIPYITGPADFNLGQIRISKWTEKPKTIASKGDVLLTVKGSGAGSVFKLDLSNAAISRQLMAIRSSSIPRDYIFYFLLSQEESLSTLAIGNLIPGLSRKDVLSFKIPLPPTLTEQRAIATALSDVDALIRRIGELIDKKRAIKQGAMQELLTGKRRLEGFSGEWISVQLGNIINRIVGGGTPRRKNKLYWGGRIPWATVKDFSTFNPSATEEYITKEGLENSSSNLIPANTLITSTRMALGKAVIYNVDVAINQDLKALFLSKKATTLFLYYWFQNHQGLFEELGSGSTVKGISLGDLKSINIYLPSTVEEQKAIAQILSDMDAEIAALEEKQAKYRSIKQGMMQELLTGKKRLI